MELSVEALSQPDRYKLLVGAIVPRPIAWVSTVSPRGVPNLAPFSFFAGVGSNPMTLLFCPAHDEHGREKDTLRNAKPAGEGGVGEFVVNIVPDTLAARMAATAAELPYEQSEFDLACLTPAPSRVVRPFRVAESPVCFECVTQQVVRTNPGAPAGGNIVIGRVVHVFAHDDVINARLHIDPALLDAVGRMAGDAYCRSRDRFTLPRGLEALHAQPPEHAPAKGRPDGSTPKSDKPPA